YGAREASTNAVSREATCSSTPGESSSIAAEQPGQGLSQSGPNITCWTISCRLPPNNWASVTFPSGPSKTYSVSTLTMGSLRRSALSASWERVNSFSRASSRRRASSHCSRETTSGRLIVKPPVSERVRGSDSRHRYDEPVRRGWTGGGRRGGKFRNGLLQQIATEQLLLYSNRMVAQTGIRGTSREGGMGVLARRKCQTITLV